MISLVPTVVNPLELEVSRREVLRNLGYPRVRQPTPRVKQALDRLWDRARALLSPSGSYRLVDGEMAEATGMPRPTEWVGLGLCTIGPELEREEARLSQQDKMLEALLLDAYGSAAAEAAADALNLTLCMEAQRRGYHLPPRISPGYGRWAIQGQVELLDLLSAEEIGVQLTEGMMMVPRKSVSFAVRFQREPARGVSTRRRCARCGLQDCLFREEPDEGDSDGQATRRNEEP